MMYHVCDYSYILDCVLDRLLGWVFVVVITTAIIMGAKSVAFQTGGFLFFYFLFYFNKRRLGEL